MTKKLKYVFAILAILTVSMSAMSAKADNDNENGRSGKDDLQSGIAKQLQGMDFSKLLSSVKENDDSKQGNMPTSLTINPNGEFKLNNASLVSMSGVSLTVKAWGLSFTVNTSASTDLRARGGTISLADIHVGDSVSVQGRIDASSVVQANRLEDLTIAAAGQNTELRNQINALIQKLNLLLGRAGLPPVEAPTSTPAVIIPTLASISPASTTFGSTGFTLILTGTNFKNDSVMKWAGAPLTTTFVSQTQLNAAIPAANVATITNVLITVLNPGTYGGTSNALPFSVQ